MNRLVCISSDVKSKLLFICIHFMAVQFIDAGDIEQILLPTSNFIIENNSSIEVIRVQSDGLVGIGTTTPNEKLEVNGHIRMTDGNEAANTVMVGDAVGTASWEPISSIQDGIGSDDQQLQTFTLSGTDLNLTLENGGSVSVDLSPVTGTDDQNISLVNTSLSIESGNSVDLNATFATDAELVAHIVADADTNSSNELITNVVLTGTNLKITDAGQIWTTNLSSLVGTDNQNLQDFNLTGTDLKLAIENGNIVNVNLSSLVGTDDQNISSTVNVPNESVSINLENGGSTLINIQDVDSNTTNEIQDLSYNPVTRILHITNNAAATDINLSSLSNAPYITDDSTYIFTTNITSTLVINGENFIPSTTVSITNPPFTGTINSINIRNPKQIELNITTDGTLGTHDIVISNNGVLNTQWSGNGVNLFKVANNNGQSQNAAGLSCQTILNDGFSVGDGLYWVDPDGGNTANAFEVYCDMTNDGGGWTLVFRHDSSGGFFATNAEADSFNISLPGLTTKKYSILNKIDTLKNGSYYEFRLYYPDLNIRNHWKQTFDPRSAPSPTRPVLGYQAIAIDASGSFWGGLELSNSGQTFLDGSVNHNNWWYAIGSHSVYSGGIPGPGTVVTKLELYIR